MHYIEIIQEAKDSPAERFIQTAKSDAQIVNFI
jgi:hypothetical protein